MRQILIVLASVLWPVAAPAYAADDPARGEQLYAPCVACHGAQAQGNESMGAPGLTHLAPVYLVAQLQKFKAGTRGGSALDGRVEQMEAMAATLADDQAMYDTAAYIATLESTTSAATVTGDIAQGAKYYRQFCAACHGPAAEGNPALNSPRLVGADDWYIVSQLEAFRSGTRGSNPQDRTGKQMRVMAGVLPDDAAVASVAAYIRSLEQ